MLYYGLFVVDIIFKMSWNELRIYSVLRTWERCVIDKHFGAQPLACGSRKQHLLPFLLREILHQTLLSPKRAQA